MMLRHARRMPCGAGAPDGRGAWRAGRGGVAVSRCPSCMGGQHRRHRQHPGQRPDRGLGGGAQRFGGRAARGRHFQGEADMAASRTTRPGDHVLLHDERPLTGSITWSSARRSSSRGHGGDIAVMGCRPNLVRNASCSSRAALRFQVSGHVCPAPEATDAIAGGESPVAGLADVRSDLRFCPGLARPLRRSPVPALARGAPDSFADLSAKLLPTVVNIATSQTLKAPPPGTMPDLPPGSPLEDLFKNFLGPQRQRAAPCHLAGLGLHHRSRPATSSPTIM